MKNLRARRPELNSCAPHGTLLLWTRIRGQDSAAVAGQDKSDIYGNGASEREIGRMDQLMTRDELVDLTRRFLDAFNREDLDAVMEFFADDGIYDEFNGKRNIGKAAIRAAFVPQFTGAFGTMRFSRRGPLCRPVRMATTASSNTADHSFRNSARQDWTSTISFGKTGRRYRNL